MALHITDFRFRWNILEFWKKSSNSLFCNVNNRRFPGSYLFFPYCWYGMDSRTILFLINHERNVFLLGWALFKSRQWCLTAKNWTKHWYCCWSGIISFKWRKQEQQYQFYQWRDYRSEVNAQKFVFQRAAIYHQ